MSCYSVFSLIHNFFSLSIFFFFFLVHSLPPTCLPPLLILFRDQSWANSITLIRCNLRSIPSISILSVRTSGNPRKRGKLIQTPAKMSEHGWCCGVYTFDFLGFSRFLGIPPHGRHFILHRSVVQSGSFDFLWFSDFWISPTLQGFDSP